MQKNAFTLIELLVVVSIITVLIALLMPSLKHARETAVLARCMSNQRQLAMAIFNYADENYFKMPLGYVSGNNYHGNYYLAHNGGPVVMLGVLYDTGHVTESRFFYCAGYEWIKDESEHENYAVAFDNGKLKWQNMTGPAPFHEVVRGSILARPVVQWDDVTAGQLEPRSGDETQDLPRVPDYASKAIISCNNYSVIYGDPHLGGTAATRGDGSTHYIPPGDKHPKTGHTYTEIAEAIRAIGHSPTNNNNIRRIWRLYDGR